MGQRWGREETKQTECQAGIKADGGRDEVTRGNRSFEKTLELGETVPCSIVTGIRPEEKLSSQELGSLPNRDSK